MSKRLERIAKIRVLVHNALNEAAELCKDADATEEDVNLRASFAAMKNNLDQKIRKLEKTK